MIQIVDLVWCFFYPDVFLYFFKPIICKLKKKIHDGRSCRFWNCRKYVYCSQNGKCMNDSKSSKKPTYPLKFYIFDVFCLLAMLLFGVGVMIIYHVIFGILTSSSFPF